PFDRKSFVQPMDEHTHEAPFRSELSASKIFHATRCSCFSRNGSCFKLEGIRRCALANRYGCPNPICTQQFDATPLSGAASVTCQQCGLVVPLKPSGQALASTIAKGNPIGAPHPAKAVANGSVPTSAPILPNTVRPVAVPVPVGKPAISQLTGLSAGPIVPASLPEKKLGWVTRSPLPTWIF